MAVFLIYGTSVSATLFLMNARHGFDLAGAAFVFTFAWGLSAFILVFGIGSEAARIGLSAEGVRVRQFWREKLAGWDSVQPQLLGPTPYGGVRLTYRPDGSKGVRFVLLTKDQTLALLRHRSAPRWRAPADVREKWGLSP